MDMVDNNERQKDSHHIPNSNINDYERKEISISETGMFAYVAICTITLMQLFPETWNDKFNKEYIETLCGHLKINQRIKPALLMLMEEQNCQDLQAYIELLRTESMLENRLIMIIKDMVTLAVQQGKYDARQRVLIRKVAELFEIPLDLLELYECSLVEILHHTKANQSQNDNQPTEETNRRKKIREIKRFASVGLATIAGGALIGLTGGLAAPFIGLGVGTILGSGAALAIGSASGVAVVSSIFGLAGAGLTGYKMNKRVGQIEEFGFEPLMELKMMQKQLHITIAVSGWLKNDDPQNIIAPWQYLDHSKEQYVLRYETKYLLELGQALEYVLSIAVSVATQEALKYTILSSLVSAIAWPAALLSMASVIDNPWSVCCRRSSEVGKELAHVLLKRQHGNRPVTLVGFSLGARVIFYCLREMAEIGGAEGVVQDAIMLGAPVTHKINQWNLCSKFVAGNIINGYCRSDWLLRFLYRTLSMTTGVAGLMPISSKRITNVDLTSIITGHSEYSEKLPQLLQYVGIRTKQTKIVDVNGMLKSSSLELSRIHDLKNQSISESKSETCLSSKTYLHEECENRDTKSPENINAIDGPT